MNCRSNHSKVSGGFPHSDIHGSKPIPGSPWLNAGYHVLHRLLLPRHPPNALFALDLIQKEQNHWFVGFLIFGPKAVLSHATSVDVAVSVLDLEQYRSRSDEVAFIRSGICLTDISRTIPMFLSKRCQLHAISMPSDWMIQHIIMCSMIKSCLAEEWWVKMDSNHRPYAYQAYALTT